MINPEFSFLPRTRSSAITLGVTYYFTERPCKHGHIDKRHVRDGCRKCSRIKESAREKTPSGRVKKRVAEARRRKTSVGKAARAVQEKRKIERIKADPLLLEAYREKQRERKRRYRTTPNGKAYTRRRSLEKELKVRQATPPWHDRASVNKFLSGCPDGHHIDHIIPLRGKNVSGLHVTANLQYLPAQENMRKSNKVDPLTLDHVICVLPVFRTYTHT